MWFPFAATSGRWDDLAALRRAVCELSGESTGVLLELCVQGGAAADAADEAEGHHHGASEGDYVHSGCWTALRCVRTTSHPVRFGSIVEYVPGEVSGPMSMDPCKSAGTSLAGGPSYGVAQYRLIGSKAGEQRA